VKIVDAPRLAEVTITSMVPLDHPMRRAIEAALAQELSAHRDWTATILPFPGTNSWMIRLERISDYQLRALAIDPTAFDETRFRGRVRALLTPLGR
jgi:hypothetical protein